MASFINFSFHLYNWTRANKNCSSWHVVSPDPHHNKLLAFYSSRFTIYHKSLANLRVAVGEYTLIKYAGTASEKEVGTGCEVKEGDWRLFFFLSLGCMMYCCLHCQKFFIKQLSRNNDNEYPKDEKIRRESSEQSLSFSFSYLFSFLTKSILKVCQSGLQLTNWKKYIYDVN